MTLRELQTVYGVEDLHNLIEIGMVHANNQAAWRRHEEKNRPRSES